MANQYTIDFVNHLDQPFRITLTPKAGFTTTLPLPAAAGTVRLLMNFNDDTKVQTGIISKELEFGYLFDPGLGIGISEFIADDFDAWKVTMTLNGQVRPYFQGYLSINNNSQPFTNRPEAINLRATCGLSALKSIDFLDANDDPYEGKYTVLRFITGALAKLGLTDINLRTLFNITNVTMIGRTTDASYDPLDNIYIESELFTGRNCYDVLNLILKNLRSRLYQEDGYHWFESLGERLLTQPFSWSEYSIPGTNTGGLYDYTQVDNKVGFDYSLEIGKGKSVYPVNADAIKYIQIGKKETAITFNYTNPNPWFCNQDFDELNIPITTSPSLNTYQLECWQHQKLGSFSSPLPPVFISYIQQEIDTTLDEETIRFAVLQTESNNAGSACLRSPLFEIGKFDKLTFSVTRRLKNGYTGVGTEAVAYIVLYGDDGNNYFLDEDEGWVLTNASLSINQRFIGYNFTSESRADWITVNVTSKHAPIDGRIEIILIEGSFPAGGYPNETRFRDVEIDITTYLSETEKEAESDTNKVYDGRKMPESYTDTAEISDIPYYKRYIRGGLYKDTTPDLRTLWNRQWDFYGNFVADCRFQKLMATVLHCHQARPLYKVETSLKQTIFVKDGLQYPVGLLPRYRFTELDPFREFMLTGNFELDFTTGTWSGVFVETMEDYNANEYAPTAFYEFTYNRQ